LKAHNDEDVQVFTCLPPKVDGSLRCYLKLKVLKINLFDNFNNNNVKNSLDLVVKIFWWGEDGDGCKFRPKINGQTRSNIQTTAKYLVKSGPKQLAAYLNGNFAVILIYFLLLRTFY
jgi:hypothetical protein